MNDMYSILIILIAAGNVHAAWLANRAFNAIRRTDVGDRFKWGFVLTAISWGLFSLGSQQFFYEPSEFRTLFIFLGLVTKLIGVMILVLGLRKLDRSIREFK